MSVLNDTESMLLIIDIQEKLLHAIFNRLTVQPKSEILAKTAKILNIPAIITEQYPKGLGETVKELKDALPEDVKILEKDYFSALNNKEIAEAIQETKRKQVLVVGIETHICVNQTVADLIKSGYEVFVVTDACGSRAESEYKAGLERMRANGAQLITTEIALFEWLKSSKHQNFKEIQSLIK